MPALALFADDMPVPEALESAWLAALPDEARRRLLARPSAAARRRSLVATRLLAEALRRLGLGGAAGAEASRRSPRGKPLLAPPWHCSVSHSEGRVACAVADQPIGIDVEAIGADVAAGFPSHLDAAERAWAGDDARRFHVVWTRKEAIAKAAGDQGLRALPTIATMSRAGADAVDAAGARGDAPPTLVAHHGVRFHVEPIEVGAGHVAHAARALAAGVARPSCKLDVDFVVLRS